MKKIVLSLVVSLFAVTSFSMPKYYFGIGDGKTHPMNQDNFTDAASSGNSHSYFGGYNLSEKWGFELAHNVFDFDNRQVSEIMTPSHKMFALDKRKREKDHIDMLIREGYSRVPIYEDTIDNMI